MSDVKTACGLVWLEAPRRLASLQCSMATSDLVYELLITREVSQPGIDAACCLTYDFNGSERGVSPGLERLGRLRQKFGGSDAENRTVFVFV